MSAGTWSDNLPAERLRAREETRARMCPAIETTPVVDPAPAVLAYLWYWSLADVERRKVDEDNEEMRRRLNYV